MKWFFLMSFLAALFCSLFWTGVISFLIATDRFRGMGVRGPALFGPLVFFVWGAREMYRSFKAAGLDQ